MLDIKLFRESIALVKKSQKARYKDPKTVDEVIKWDTAWRKTVHKVQALKQKRNAVSKEINLRKKQNKSVAQLITQMKGVTQAIAKADALATTQLTKRNAARYAVGNILHASVPIAKTEAGNKLVRKSGRIPSFTFKPKSHTDLLESLDVADIERAAKVSGSRFYYLKNELVILNLALIRFAMDFLMKQGFTLMWTPYLMSKNAMEGASELADFEEQLYGATGNLFLIATSEQTLAAYHMNESIREQDLPLTYAGFSTCFRREAGSHGKDTKGIFRVHQFDKVEQYVLCKPEESWKWHEKMIKNSEALMRALGLPWRTVNIASGEMNDNAAKKYDVEVWSPITKTYREMISCSNCTDYQARKLNIKLVRKNGEREVVHTINATAIATERLITVLLENFQQADGSVNIPKALWKYTGFKVIRPKK